MNAFAAKINEQILIYPFIVATILYIVFYGAFISYGFVESELSLWFLLVFIPIILIDCLKTGFECCTGTFFHDHTIRKENLDNITVIIPTKDGGETIEATIKSLLRRFRPEQIIVASNGSTDNTGEIVRNYPVTFLDIKEPIGKIEAINQALSLVKTDYCITMDDDVLIGDAKIPTKLLKSASGVAFRVLPKITNWVTQIQSYEYRKSMDVGKNFHNSSATVQNISGAIGLFSTKELIRQTKIHTGEFSGEDLQRTLLILLKKNKNRVVLSRSIVETEVPNTLWSLYKQRVFGWNPGLLANAKNLFKILIKRDTHPRLRYEVFYTLFLVLIMDPLRLISLPIIIWYPKMTIIIYLFYILLELIPYLKLKSQEPIWVLFVTPIYGLFNFLARINALMIFMYRRIAVFLAQKTRFDDYRKVDLKYRLASLVISCLAFMLMIIAVTYIVKPIVGSTFFQTLLAFSLFL